MQASENKPPLPECLQHALNDIEAWSGGNRTGLWYAVEARLRAAADEMATANARIAELEAERRDPTLELGSRTEREGGGVRSD